MKKPGKAALARARALYEQGATPLSKIAATLGLSDAAFRALRKREAWPPRAAPQPPREREACCDALDTQALEKRLARALRREIARAESEIENSVHPGAERKARILGLLVKTLGDLRRLGASDRAAQKATDEREDKDDDASRDHAPRDLATLREALARRLERLRGDGAAG